jgi:hypothetical protein
MPGKLKIYCTCSWCVSDVFGETIPSDSFVDLDDILNTGGGPGPSNRNPRNDAVQCITDLVDCCGTESDTPSGIVRTVRGDWYFPDGTRVESTGSRLVKIS